MRKLFPLMLTALAVFVLPQVLRAEDQKPAEGPATDKPAATPAEPAPAEQPTPRHRRPDPAELFKWLDANGDGQLTLEELRPRAKERIGKWFPDADKNKDGKLSEEEFITGLREWRERHPGPAEGDRPRRRPERPEAGRGPRGPASPPEARRERPNPEQLFKQFDKNHDNVLSPEEFTEGMKGLHRLHRMQGLPGPHGGPGMGPPEWPMGPEGAPDAPPRDVLMNRPGGLFFALSHGGHDHPGGPPPPEAFCWLGMVGKAMFDKLDANKDGKIEASEVPEPCRDRFERLLARVDKDGDKAVSIAEAQEAAEAMIERMQMGVRWLARGPHAGPEPGAGPAGPEEKLTILRLLDTDHDGAISGREIIFASARLMMLDRNHDGVVTERELMAPPCGPPPRLHSRHAPEFRDGHHGRNAPPSVGDEHREQHKAKHKTDAHEKTDDKKADPQKPAAGTPEGADLESDDMSYSDLLEPSEPAF